MKDELKEVKKEGRKDRWREEKTGRKEGGRWKEGGKKIGSKKREKDEMEEKT